MIDSPIVTQSFGIIAVEPNIPNSVVGELQGCCYKSPVLGDLSDPVNFKNDINGFLFKKNFSGENIVLTLEKNGGSALGGTDIPLVDNTYGTFYNFGDFTLYPNYIGYQIHWRNVLIVDGEGTYRLRVDSTLLTGSSTSYSVSFNLKTYSEQRASGTFRIQSIMNGYLRNPDFDYSGLNWLDGLRVEGFFGNRQAEYEEERIIYRNRQVKQLRSELLNKYTCQTLHIPSCITDSIIEYHNFANVILFTGYNARNHKNTYVQKEIILAIIVPLIAVPIIALIGFFLKGLLKSVQLAISKQSVSIEKLEKSQNDSLKGLDEKFTSFQLTIQKVFLTLTSVEKDLERANENLNKTNQIANRNSELIAEHKNKIFNLDNNLKQLMTELKEQEKKVDLLTRSLFGLKTNCEK